MNEWEIEGDEIILDFFSKKTIDKRRAQNILRKIRALENDPFGSPNVGKLKGGTNEFRLRVGNIRIVCHVDSDSRVVTITKADFRKDVYREQYEDAAFHSQVC